MVKEGYKFSQEEVKSKLLKMELCFEHYFFRNCEKNFDIEINAYFVDHQNNDNCKNQFIISKNFF